ncbi:MAG: hypothetical protein JWN30_1476 [Bacilli bacterium]|nr:hypothetical protein [Bacilli bacterium]
MNSAMPIFNTYEEVETALWQVVHEHFFQGDFLTTLAAGSYKDDQIREFAIQYSFYSRHFPRVLGAAISAMPPLDSWWIPLADNLWDEAGRGAEGKSHALLYRTFLTSVDPSIHYDAKGYPIGATMQDCIMEAIDTFIKFFRACTPLQAMAAVGLGSELFAGAVMGKIGEGLQHPAYNQNRAINTLFWAAHADEHEPRHYQLCKDILQTFSQPDELRVMFETGSYIAQSEARMYDKIHRHLLGK